jgi:hypothetical protein
MDSIGSDLMSRAGAGDAASALRLVAGARCRTASTRCPRAARSLRELAAERRPPADGRRGQARRRARPVPASVIESIQVSKTFTPDQQGDASGGAVNVKLKGIPDESILQSSCSSAPTRRSWPRRLPDLPRRRPELLGPDDGGRDIQTDHIGGNWDGAAASRNRRAARLQVVGIGRRRRTSATA